MEYSFSQTFGRHINFLAISPTPSFKGSNKKGSSDERNSSINDMSFEQSHNRSPVIQSYKINKSPLSNKKSTRSVFSDYINELARESKSKSELKRYQQTMRRKKQAELKAQIENVEGLNQRMVRLIQDLKIDCQEKKSTKRQTGRQNEDTKRKSTFSTNKQNIVKIDKSKSFTGFETNNRLMSHNTQVKEFRNKNLIRQGKENYLNQGFDEKANKLKVRIEERLSTRKKTQSIFFQEHQNQLTFPLSLKHEDHTISSVLDKLKENRSQLKVEKKASIGSVNLKELSRDSYMRSKVKTIESELQTNFNEFQEDTVIETINQISLIENGSKIQNDTVKRDQSSIAQDLNETQNSEKEKVCKQCGCQKKADKKKLNTNQSYESSERNWSKNFGKYESIGFEDKIKKINQKIENYQKKLNMHNQTRKTPMEKTDVASIKKIDSHGKTQKVCDNYEKGQIKKRQDSFAFEKKQKDLVVREIRNQEPKEERDTNINYYQKGFQMYETKKKSNLNDIPFNNKQNYSFTKNKQILNCTLNLQKAADIKEKIGLRLGLSTPASVILRQIQLDQELRKVKKQFSKLSQSIPGQEKTKWDYLLTYLPKSEMQKNSLTKQFFRQNFELTDEEADPFYSVSVQDMRSHKEIIKELVNAYMNSQEHFKNNLEGKLSNSEISSIFKISQLRSSGIRLDQFTVWINNSTKVNHKCRDVYLLFKRIWLRKEKLSENKNKKNDQWFNIQDLQAVLEIDPRERRLVQDMEKQKKWDEKCRQKIDRKISLRIS